jgi:hypothetical protein
VIELAAQFVATTDEVSRLQSGSDPECVFFQQMANHGHYGGRPGTRQGTYVCSPSGEFLASINSNSAGHVLEMMQEGLAAWKQLPAERRRLPAENKIRPQHRWEESFPTGGLILSVISRDLPEQCDPLEPAEVKWNQDHVWFSKEEARRWLGDNPQPGDIHQVPDDLVVRLARFHLVDNVNGQTPRFTREGVRGSKISTEIVSRDGASVELKITGETVGAAAEGWWQSPNGVVTRLLGNATFDLDEARFVKFEMLALGRRWGYTRFNGRRRDGESGPVGFVFRLRDPDSYRIAPAQIGSYDADWVVRPEKK